MCLNVEHRDWVYRTKIRLAESEHQISKIVVWRVGYVRQFAKYFLCKDDHLVAGRPITASTGHASFGQSRVFAKSGVENGRVFCSHKGRAQGSVQ